VAGVVDAVVQTTGGNPFLLEELVRALEADGVALSTALPAQITQLSPQTVSRSLLLRLGRLPDGAARVARAVAVLAGEAEAQHAAALAGLDDAAAGAAADALAAAHILAPSRPLAFVHPLVRTAVYEDIPGSERGLLHARAAALLRGSGASPSQLAPHLLATDPDGDAGTVDLLRAAAARSLGQGAPDLACRYLARALREPPGPEVRPTVLAELGEAEWLGGDVGGTAVAHLRVALDAANEPGVRAQRALALHRALFAAGQVQESCGLLERELEHLRPHADPEVILRVEAELDAIALLHPDTVAAAGARLAGFEQLHGRTPATLLQLANVACWKWARGTGAETTDFGTRALADARIQAADVSDSVPIYEALWALCHTDETAVALRVLDGTLADARGRGSVFGLTTTCALRALIAYRHGDVGGAEAEARVATDLPGMSPFARPPLFGILALALVARGELADAEAAIAQSGCGPDLPEFVCLNPIFFARGTLRLAQGRPQEALADFRELGDRTDRLGLRNPVDGWRLGAVEALVALDQADAALALADEQMALARAWGTPSAIGIALHRRALAAGAQAEPLAEAVAALGATPARLEQARAIVDLGAALRRTGQRARARDVLRDGHDLARRLGATVLAERAHDELLIAGSRPRRLMFSGVESLTPSERRVAEMAAEGLSNREIAQELFVTAKTVENQLGRVYAKLGIRSRTGLRPLLAA
jgi:DNA-binding CsgD family transcriptional regulator